MKHIGQDLKQNGKLTIAILVVTIVSYSIYLFLPDSAINQLGQEDGVFEYLTAFFFLGTSLFFVWQLRQKFNLFYLALALLFFMGFGEEISWGQRIFGFGTPESLAKHNVQGETTLHNLEILNSNNFDSTLKTGWKKLLTVNFLYRVFCVSYGFILPLLVLLIGPIKSLVDKIKLPVPSIVLGFCFVLSWSLFKLINSVLLPAGRDPQYYDTAGEIFEFISSLIFFAIAFAFFELEKSKRLPAGQPK